MLLIAFYRRYALTVGFTLLALGLSLAACFFSSFRDAPAVTSLMTIDGYTVFYMALIHFSALIVTLLAWDYLTGRTDVVKEEFYLLLLTAVLGGDVLAASANFVSFFLGLEILSASLYVLIAYLRSEPLRIEAGIKYLVPAATSTSFLLFGTAMIYADSGVMTFSGVAEFVNSQRGSFPAFFLAGMGMILVGFGFKIALVPFHLWAADVYQGAPTPISAFIATASKGAVLAALVRLFSAVRLHEFSPAFYTLTLIAVATMFVGNLLALFQGNIKRLLAYSSIAHMGYLLVALLAGGAWAVTAASVYLAAYFISVLGVFAVLTVLSDKKQDFQNIADCRGLAYDHPCLAGILTVMLFSLAGIPLTAGFLAKFYVFSAGVSQQLWLPVGALVVNSVISLFYYLRVIIALFARPINAYKAPSQQPVMIKFITGCALTILTLLLFWFGLFPNPLIRLIRTFSNNFM
jgi:NADH-quinone oxidoreductase subunit N